MPPNKTLHLSDGQTLRYDAAVLATGGEPNPLELPGADLPQVFVLRSKAQAEQIMNAASPDQRAVIIGDSFIALECASALRQHGLDVTVLARHAIPFAAQFGEAVGKAIRALHEENGVKFINDHEATEIIGDGKVEAVLLDNGLRHFSGSGTGGDRRAPGDRSFRVTAEGKRSITAR